MFIFALLAACTSDPEPSPPAPVPSTTTTDPSTTPPITTPPTTTPTTTSSPTQLSWSSVGPGGGGWITSLAMSASGTLFVGCDVGGAYRSVDGGQSYEIINTGLENYVVLTVTVHPTEPNTVFLGTAGGVYKSVDSGDTWQWKRSGFPAIEEFAFAAPISALIFDPADSNTLYAGVGESNQHTMGAGTVYKSNNGGEDWVLINTGAQKMHPDALIYELEFTDHGLFASTDHGLYLSTDGGVNWVAKNEGLPYANVRALAASSVPEALYVTVHVPPGERPWRGGVYKSLDGGDSWQPQVEGLGHHVGAPGDPDEITANYGRLVMNPDNGDELYVAAVSWWDAGIFKTVDGGEHWEELLTPTSVTPGWIAHEDWSAPAVSTLLVNPLNPDQVFFADSWQLFGSEDAGSSWDQIYTEETSPGSNTWRGRGVETTVVYSVEVSPTEPEVLYVGYWDIGLFKSEDSGESFTRLTEGLQYPNNVFDIIVDPLDSNVIYISSGWWEYTAGDVAKSVDGGATWQVVGRPGTGLPDAQVYSMALVPSANGQSTVYAASYGYGLFKSTDGAESWSAVGDGLFDNGNKLISTVVVHPEDSQVVYAGVDLEIAWSLGMPSDQYGGVYRSEDAGDTWEKLAVEVASVMDIDVSPHNPNTLYVASQRWWDDVNQREFPGGVFRSTDGGATWDHVLNNLLVREVKVDPHRPGVVYAATSDLPYHDQSTGDGVMRSMDGGDTWQPVNDGLSHLAIGTLEIHPTDPTVMYLGSGGNGVFRGVLTP